MTNIYDQIRSNNNNIAFANLSDLQAWKHATVGQIVKVNENDGSVSWYKITNSSSVGSVEINGSTNMYAEPITVANAARLAGLSKAELIKAYYDESSSVTSDTNSTFGTSEIMFRDSDTFKKMTGAEFTKEIVKSGSLTSASEVDTKITTAFTSRNVTLGDGLQGSANLGEGLNLNLNVGDGLGLSSGQVKVDLTNLTSVNNAEASDQIIVKTSSGLRKITKSQFLGSVTGALQFRGAVDPTNGTVTGDTLNPSIDINGNTAPHAEPGDDPRGYCYIATVKSSITIGDDIKSTEILVGDMIIWSKDRWNVIPNYNNVQSVFGRTGTITAEKGDYSADLITTTNGSTVQEMLNNISEIAGTPKSVQCIKDVTKGTTSISVTPVTDGSFTENCQVIFCGLTLTKDIDYTVSKLEEKVNTITLSEGAPVDGKLIIRDVIKE